MQMYDQARSILSSKRGKWDGCTTMPALWATPVVVFHLLLGTVVFAWAEGWAARDALYFSVAILTTVGDGDLAPKTDVAKAFCCMYVVCGVTIVSACLGVVLGRIKARVRFGQGSPARSVVSAAVSMAVIVAVGATVVHASEGWSALDSVYWAVMTCTSVGQSDLSISTDSRILGLAYMFVAIGTFSGAAARIVNVCSELQVEKAISAFVADGVSEEFIAEIKLDGDGSVDKFEFLSYMLVHTGKVDKHEIQMIAALFSSLDLDGSGKIGKSDIHNAMALPDHTSIITPTASLHIWICPTLSTWRQGGEYLTLAPPLQDITYPKAVVVAALAANLHTWICQTLSTWIQGAEYLAFAPRVQDIVYPKVVDAVLAALGLAMATAVMHAVDATAVLPVQFFAPPMLASGIIFFAGPRPPVASNFAIATLGAFAVGTSLHLLKAVDSVSVQCLAAGMLVLFFRLTGAFFPPTVVLATFLAPVVERSVQPLSYLAAPWCIGHLLLYGFARAISMLRQRVRVEFAKQGWRRQLRSTSGSTDAQGVATRRIELCKIFDRYDTSGDGFLDPTELKLALRKTTGSDVDLDDAERLLRSIDTDGDGLINFDEFVMAIDEHL